MSNYEAKVSGLEHEIETQREEYEKKLVSFSERLEAIESSLKILTCTLHLDCTRVNNYQTFSEILTTRCGHYTLTKRKYALVNTRTTY